MSNRLRFPARLAAQLDLQEAVREAYASGMPPKMIQNLVIGGMKMFNGHTYTDVEKLINASVEPTVHHLLVLRGFRHPTLNGVKYKPGQVISTQHEAVAHHCKSHGLAESCDPPPGSVLVYSLDARC